MSTKGNGYDHIQSLKEVIRHAFFRAGLNRVLDRRRGVRLDHLGEMTPEKIFSRIYDDGLWLTTRGQESRSGAGSAAAERADLVGQLDRLIRQLDCKSMIDVGCGDWAWMRSMNFPCRYLGIDVTPSVIEANKKRFERAGVKFEVLDAVNNPVPLADFALCREVIFHLSFRDGRRMLSNISKSATWICVTSDSRIWFNSDIRTGDFRMLNLQKAPFRFPMPDFRLYDASLVAGRGLCVWRSDRIRELV